MSQALSRHYSRLAQSYDKNWSYSPAFIAAMSKAIITALRLQAEDVIADVGGGTGLYTREIIRAVNPSSPAYCIDPSQEMLDQAPKMAKLITKQASAEDLAKGVVRGLPIKLDAILVKEAIHHVDDVEGVVTGLAELLNPGGRLLVVMLPTRIQYPLFEAALARFAELQPDPRNIAGLMGKAGLKATVETFEYALEFEADRYIRMVRDRYMSLLSSYDDEELEAGIREIRSRYPAPILRFNDEFAFVLGEKDARI